LGRSSVAVAPLALGGNVFGWTIDEPTSFAVLDAFVDEGLNLIDTADVYSAWKPGNTGGESETLIGKWLKRSGKRAHVVLATKVGMWANQAGLGAATIAAAVEGSLRRLQTDVIDVYQAHKDDPNTPLEETMTAFDALVKAGKVRVLGASNYSAPRLGEALAVSRQRGLARFESLQPEYNLYDRAGYEEALEPLVRREHVGVIGYFSLARGFLTGKYRSAADLGQSVRGGGVKAYLNTRGDRILKVLDEVARPHGATLAQVALAWLMARPGVTAPIASATSVTQLKELAGATRLALTADDVNALNDASA
jgi:aryl-alcohol dehydrogenase-like predicted oxidoreductase